MALTAPLSAYKKKTWLIWMAVLAGFAAYCVYDGYFNDNFKAKHSSTRVSRTARWPSTRRRRLIFSVLRH